MSLIIKTKGEFDICSSEQQFKTKYMHHYFGSENESFHKFCIESEATMVGFPDVMTIRIGKDNENIATFYEFKFAKVSGIIKFQSTQPSFYKRHPNMKIDVIAYNKKTKTIHIFKAKEILDKTSPYYTTDNTINLCKVEQNEVKA